MAFKTPNLTSEYIRNLLPKEQNAILLEMENYADANFVPILLPESVAFLRQLIILQKPKKILEIGMAIGYSGHVMLQSYGDSQLFCIEISEEFAEIAKNNFEKSNLSDRVTVFLGDAAEILPCIDGEFDFIFLDGPKAQYIEYFPYLKKHLAEHGMLLCDNVLFNGLISGEKQQKKPTSLVKKIDLFLNTLMSDNDLISSILPIGDGMSLSIKK